jgi:FkbM family methyltransferase
MSIIRGRFPRRWMIALGAVLFGTAILGLRWSHVGEVTLVRSYVRLDRAWVKYFPFASGNGLIRRLDPLMTRLGVLKPVRVELEPGVSLLLDPNDDVARTMLVSRRSEWEPQVWAAISSGLGDGKVFFDVGAYIGYYSLKASPRLGRTGRVVAFEPNPNTLPVLRANIAASGATNVTVEPIACTDTEQTLTFFDATPGGNSGSSSLARANAGSRTRSYTVRGRPIDDVVDELGLGRVDVIKVDVEGAELLVLRGTMKVLARHHPKVILEVVPRQLAAMNATVGQLESLLTTLGYNTTRMIDYKNREWTVR